MHIIIEGIDHCGKDTLINNLQNKYGGRVVHSSKPLLLDKYSVSKNEETASIYKSMVGSKCLKEIKESTTIIHDPYITNERANSYFSGEMYEYEKYSYIKDNAALFVYQKHYFESMFNSMINSKECTKKIDEIDFTKKEYNIFYNRFHLGEYVYGKLYRNYNSAMMTNVFLQESEFLQKLKTFNAINNYHVILLLMHNPSLREHDEHAFNFSNGEKEQDLFLKAFNYSKLNKSIVYVDTPNGEWRKPSEIQEEVERYAFGKFLFDD